MPQKLRLMTAIYLISGGRWLLLERKGSRIVSNGSFTGTAGGHFEPEDQNDPKACVLRELYEETGLTEEDISDLSLRYICLRNKNGEIRQNHYFFAKLKDPAAEIHSKEGSLHWIEEGRLLDLPMPHSARAAVQHYLTAGRYTDQLYIGTAAPEGAVFHAAEEF